MPEEKKQIIPVKNKNIVEINPVFTDKLMPGIYVCLNASQSIKRFLFNL